MSNGHTFDFLFNRSFLDIVEKNQDPFFFLKKRIPSASLHNLKWRAKFQTYRLHIRDYDWLNFIQFSGYKYKIRLVSILRKREDQALISISTILKFSALRTQIYNILAFRFRLQGFLR